MEKTIALAVDRQQEIQQQLIDLGLTLDEKRSFEGESRRIQFSHPETGKSWRGVDPQEQLQRIPQVLHTLFFIDWRGTTRTRQRTTEGTYHEVEFSRTTENFDTYYNDERVLLYQIAWNVDTQVLYAIDLLDTNEDPRVYGLEPDGSEIVLEYYTLSDFLRSLESQH